MKNPKKKGGDPNSFIGQFGVGFYSAFLVAEKVVVRSKSYKETGFGTVWECTNGSSYVTYEDKDEKFERGTEITLHIRDDAKEFLEYNGVADILKKYSEFINFPIFAMIEIETEKMVPLTEEELESQKKTNDERNERIRKAKEQKEKLAAQGLSMSGGGSDEEEQPDSNLPTEKSTIERHLEYSQVNPVKPIWVRNPKEVDAADYERFYKAFTKKEDTFMKYSHFNVEGDIEFKAILFVPKKAEFNPYDSEDVINSLSVFVRRVFITSEYTDILPRYMSFLQGLVDSDDIPLNISRETIQESRLIRVIKKKLVRKALEMFKDMSEDEESYKEKFYPKYGLNLKLGILQDESNKNKLAELLRFQSSQKPFTSLESYLERLKPKQSGIFYITGGTKEEIEKNPLVELVVERGYEILYCVDPMDEQMIKTLDQYEGKTFYDITKKDFKFGDETEEQKANLKQFNEEYKPLTTWWQTLVSDEIDKIVISDRLTTSPCVITTSDRAYSAHMLKLMKTQKPQGASTNEAMYDYMMKMKKTLEINPNHPVIKELLKIVLDDKTEESKPLAMLLYYSAQVSSGYDVTDPKSLNEQIDHLIRFKLGVDSDAKTEYTVKPAPTDDDLKSDEEEATKKTVDDIEKSQDPEKVEL